MAGRNRLPEAEALIAQAEQELPSEHRTLALATCYEVVNKLEKAQKLYQEAYKDPRRNDDPAVVRGYASFLVQQNKPREAEATLRRLTEYKVHQATEEDVSWARNALAVVLSVKGDQASFKEALSIVGRTLNGVGDVVEDPAQRVENSVELRRTLAHVLATRSGRAERMKAIALLEELDHKEGLAEGDHYLLQELYESSLSWDKEGVRKAEGVLLKLVEKHPQTPKYQARLILNLLRQEGRAEEAYQFLNRLETLERDLKLEQNQRATVELWARVMEARQQGRQAVAKLEEYVNRPNADKKDILLLIESLTRQKRPDKALEFCEKAWQTCKPEEIAGKHVGLLRMSGMTGPALLEARRHLTTALLTDGRSVPVLLALAELEDLRGQYDEEERLYIEVLRVDPNNVAAMNNLAYLQALRSQGPAEKWIGKAINLLGPRSDLLDTRALAYLAQNLNDLARADLESSINDSPTGLRYFHLARYHFQTKDPANVEKALQKARELGLKRYQIHPLERQVSAQLLEHFHD